MTSENGGECRSVIGVLSYPLPKILIVLTLMSLGVVLVPNDLARANDNEADPNAACAPCHQAIYERYRHTPMANASGPAVDALIPADFLHALSGVHYEIKERDGRAWMSYERIDNVRPLSGRQELRYFLGSGRRGRTYLFEQEGYWFEAPINWYSKKRIWDMAPNHLADSEMPLTMPVDSGCLRCHASGVASSLPDARNHYAGPPITHGGILCTSCHGDGSAHIASQGRTGIMNLSGLEPIRKDSLCLSCHLEGDVAVARDARKFEDYTPGDNLFDSALFFVYRGTGAPGSRAVSQWEALLKSACKKASGDRLTCTTCHDPHGSPAPEERVAFYRQRCLTCHDRPGFVARHHPEQADCVSCHMAASPSSDIAHEQVTDHFIRKRVDSKRTKPASSGELEAVGGFIASDRELGLAYAQMADRGDPAAAIRAIELLRRAEKEDRNGTSDVEVHVQLGYLEQVSGHPEVAASEYRHALAASPYNSLALGNLAFIEAQNHRDTEAAKLWRQVFSHDPTELNAGQNLAIVDCRAGDAAGAVDTLERMLVFAPDNGKARSLLAAIRADETACRKR